MISSVKMIVYCFCLCTHVAAQDSVISYLFFFSVTEFLLYLSHIFEHPKLNIYRNKHSAHLWILLLRVFFSLSFVSMHCTCFFSIPTDVNVILISFLFLHELFPQSSPLREYNCVCKCVCFVNLCFSTFSRSSNLVFTWLENNITKYYLW